MNNILAIGASNSSKSINKKFASYVAHQVKDANVSVVDLNQLELPVYSPDLEAKSGIPQNARTFLRLISEADAIVLSLAEHNGNVTAAFKNLWDWTSRVEMKLWQDKPILLMATSPGGRGGASVLNIVKTLMPHFGGKVVADFSLPLFGTNFGEDGVTDTELKAQLSAKITLLQEAMIA